MSQDMFNAIYEALLLFENEINKIREKLIAEEKKEVRTFYNFTLEQKRQHFSALAKFLDDEVNKEKTP